MMKTPHKHAALIKAWADGAIIEVRVAPHVSWRETCSPSWTLDYEYRIKPETITISMPRPSSWGAPNSPHRIELTFDSLEESQEVYDALRVAMGDKE